jgi:tripartite-type tricarboxylate transporter receptor subunit TctC
MLAPAGTPKDAIALLHAEIVKALRLPEVAERLVGDGAVAVVSTPDEFAAYIKSQMAKWGPVIRAAGAADAQ